MAKVAEDVRLGRAFYFPSRDGFAYPWVASVSRWGGSLGYKGANPGGAGIGLITDVVASSTSADQLRTRLGERTSRVADLGISFAG